MIISKLYSRIIEHEHARVQKKKNIRFQISKVEKMRTGGCYTVLTKEQENEVQSYFLKYCGEKVSLLWHEYYLYANGFFSPKYITTIMYYNYIYPRLNDPTIMHVYSDKNMIRKLLGDRVKLPKTYVQNINGIFYADEKIITRQQAIALCRDIDDAIIKTCLDSMQGKSILRFKSHEGMVTGKNCPATIEKLFDEYESNFIVQAAIQQCDKMAKLNPTSLNTVRVMTYWSQKDGIVPLFEVARMGRSGAVIDNASSGGLYCGVNEDGTLKDTAYTLYPYSKHTQSDSGLVFKEFQIPMFDEILKKAVELHEQLPYAKLIGWDFSVDKDNEIELVEINGRQPGIFQVATGPAFGKYTEEILEYCKEMKK